jgi:uncharacterized protein YtpQ (UPF0354 family)
MLIRKKSTLLAFALSAFASLVAACEAPPGVSVERIVPVIRSKAFIAELSASSEQALPVHWLNSEIGVVYVENSSSQLRYFRVPTIDAKCWDDRSVLNQYVRNLSREVKAMRVVEVQPGVSMVAIGGNFESSLILTHRILQQAIEAPINTILVGIPNRDMLLLANPEDRPAAQRLQELVNDSFSKGRNPISTKIFLVSPCRIEVLADQERKISASCP